MREKILEYLANHPNSRQREIAGGIGVWLCDKNFLNSLHELEKEGKVHNITIRDSANMEFYYIWALA